MRQRHAPVAGIPDVLLRERALQRLQAELDSPAADFGDKDSLVDLRARVAESVPLGLRE